MNQLGELIKVIIVFLKTDLFSMNQSEYKDFESFTSTIDIKL